MYYYQVLIGDFQYHGEDALTYSYDTEIPTGSIVSVSLRKRSVLGIVIRNVVKPTFTVKPISTYRHDLLPLPIQSLELLDWLQNYYPAPMGAIVRQFLPPANNFPKENSITEIALEATHKIPNLPSLTREQTEAIKQMDGPGLHLLRGATGTGKTRVYLELTRKILLQKKSVMILTPEIGLTAQLVDTFYDQFPGRVFVFHSGLTIATRRNLWYRLLNTIMPVIIIGPRSALFTPIRNLGLIVADEAHEAAYKNESAPNYLTSRVAGKLAGSYGATFVIGSATPSIEDYYFAVQKGRSVIQMDTAATQITDTDLDIEIVDLKDKEEFPKSKIIGTKLYKAISGTLEKKEQSLIFLNRRGTARIVLCDNCGWQVHCPRCDLPLTYHGDSHNMQCHVCGFHESFPSACPECGNGDILLKSVGTKAVVDELGKLFPSAKIQRFDMDSSKSEKLEQNMSALKSGEIDILVGTQVIAKGLDLPKLSLVGIINADTSLSIPDYTAAEKTFQIISQVLGRVGRGHLKGSAIIQTYSPNNPTINAAISKNWLGFYQNELVERKQYLFPPFIYLLRLNCIRSSLKNVESTSDKVCDAIRRKFPQVIVEGPTPGFHSKVNNKYNWQVVVKAKHRPILLEIIKDLPSGWTYDIDPINLL